ncbi:MAG: alpha/beta hydrolase family protein, partial [Candidatus Acidiferrales bacterium]
GEQSLSLGHLKTKSEKSRKQKGRLVALAKAGFIAAAPLHPRNNFLDDIGDDQRIVLDGRPRQFSAVIDALLEEPAWSDRIDPEKIAAFGHSAGGYAVLAALGAEPEFSRILDHCERHAEEDPYCSSVGLSDVAARKTRAMEYAGPPQNFHDGRLCAAVIADPFAVPFSDATLKALPPAQLLFFRPEVENVVKAEFHVSRVVRLLKQRDDFPDPQVILFPKAHHFSFIAPIPESVGKSLAGPDRFDRAAFHDEMDRRTALHEEMNSTIVPFFKRAFAARAK